MATLKFDEVPYEKVREGLEHGLGDPVGYALPLKWDENHDAWKSGPWPFRREQMFLIPGASAMGMRLPLDALPWLAPEEREIPCEESQFAELPPLGNYHQLV